MKRQRTLTDVLRNVSVRSLSFRCANGSPSKVVSCPSCSKRVTACRINDHLDDCLKVKDELTSINSYGNSFACSSETPVSSRAQQGSEDFSVGEDISAAPSVFQNCPQVGPRRDASTCELLPVQLKVFKLCFAYALFKNDRLFTDEEKKFIQLVYTLPSRLQELFRNILSRKNKSWHAYREFSNLSYNNTSYCEDEFLLLQKYGLLEAFRLEAEHCSADTIYILNLLNVKELKQVYRRLYLHNVEYQGKHKLISDLSSCFLGESVVHGAQCKMDGQSPRKDCWRHIISLLGHIFRIPLHLVILFDNVCRLSCIQSSPETPLILLATMNKLKFPHYTCNYTRPAFLSRDAFREFFGAVRDEEIFDAALCNGSNRAEFEEISSKAHLMLENYCQTYKDQVADGKESRLPSFEQISHPVFKIFSGLWIFCNICWHSIPVLERKKDFKTCIRRLSLLLEFKEICSHRRGRYWNRLSLDMLHFGHSTSEVLKICLQALEDEYLNDGERVIISRRAIRLARKARKYDEVVNSSSLLQQVDKVARSCTSNSYFKYWHSIPEERIGGRPVSWSRHKRNLFFGQNDQLLGVEELCLEYYSLKGWSGIHCEGSLMTTLFGIFFWNILFMDVVDVFQNDYQRAPFDLGRNSTVFFVLVLLLTRFRHRSVL